MLKSFAKKLSMVLAASSLLALYIPVYSEDDTSIRILFTSDLNARLDSVKVTVEEEERHAGGFPALSYLIRENKDENTVVLDNGNFSGTTSYRLSNRMLSIMDDMGYDYVSLGYQEIANDTTMLEVAREEDERVTVLSSNIQYDELVEPYTITEVNGYRIGIFASLSNEYAVGIDTVKITDAYDSASNTVIELNNKDVDYIICLWQGDAYSYKQLLDQVSGIDLLVASTRNELYEEVEKIDDTVIVSGGINGRKLGLIEVNPSNHDVLRYEAIDVYTEHGTSDVATSAVNTVKSITTSAIRETELNPDTVVGYNDQDMTGITQNFLADALSESWNAYVNRDKRFSVGILTNAYAGYDLPQGNITYGTLLNAYGINSEEINPELVMGYIKGSELRKLCEIDHMYGGMYPTLALQFGSLKYTYLDDRMDYNKVVDVYVEEAHGYWAKISNDVYYPIVATSDLNRILSLADSLSDGVLKVSITDSTGKETELSTFEDYAGRQMTLLGAVNYFVESWPRTSGGLYRISNTYSGDAERKEPTSFTLSNYFTNTSMYALLRYRDYLIRVVAGIVALLVLQKVWKKFRHNTTQFDD